MPWRRRTEPCEVHLVEAGAAARRQPRHRQPQRLHHRRRSRLVGRDEAARDAPREGRRPRRRADRHAPRHAQGLHRLEEAAPRDARGARARRPDRVEALRPDASSSVSTRSSARCSSRSCPRKTFSGDDDESIASFVSRRARRRHLRAHRRSAARRHLRRRSRVALGRARACPQLVEAEAQVRLARHRDARAPREPARSRRPSGESEASTFVSLKRGVGDLVIIRRAPLRDAEVSTSRARPRIERSRHEGDPRGRWAVETSKGTLYADHVALTVPAHASSTLVADLDPDALRHARRGRVRRRPRRCSSRTASTTSAIRSTRSASSSRRARTGRSSRARSSRASGTTARPRARRSCACSSAAQAPSTSSVATTRRSRASPASSCSISSGSSAPPVFTKVFRFKRASPQPTVGHLGRMRKLLDRTATSPGPPRRRQRLRRDGHPGLDQAGRGDRRPHRGEPPDGRQHRSHHR